MWRSLGPRPSRWLVATKERAGRPRSQQHIEIMAVVDSQPDLANPCRR